MTQAKAPQKKPFAEQKETIHQLVASLIPDEEHRKRSLEIFVETINYAHSFGSSKWGVRYQTDGIRLLVGRFIVFTIHPNTIWMALDQEAIQSSANLEQLLKTGDWRWDGNSYPVYKPVPSKNGYYMPLEDYKETWAVIQPLHFAFIRNVGNKYQALRTDSQPTHSSALLQYLRQETGLFVPDPYYDENIPWGTDAKTLEQVLADFDYEIDMRSFPDEYRRVQFNIGWQDAIPRGKVYVDSTLRKLTWRNLGYRLGLQFGEKTSEEIYEIYEHFARHFGNYQPIALAEEIGPDEALYEGSKQQITVNAYERNPKARQACIDYHGAFCQICGFDFERKYGEIGRDFIHVHHLVPLANIQETYQVDPIHDLLPVCPNCHAMLHKPKGQLPYTPDELKRFLQLASEKADL